VGSTRTAGAFLRTAKDDRERAAKYGVAWQANDASEYCRLCGGRWGLLRRRHHCRACGQLVCDDCSRARMAVPGSENQKRVCDLCAVARRNSIEREADEDGPPQERTVASPDAV
jgi:hypothetical protein